MKNDVNSKLETFKTRTEDIQKEIASDALTKHLKPFNAELPTIGLLMYDGVLQSEVIATSDVFAKLTEDGNQLFNVITIAQTETPIHEMPIRNGPDAVNNPQSSNLLP